MISAVSSPSLLPFFLSPNTTSPFHNYWRAAFWVCKQLTTFSSTTNSLSPGMTFPTIS
jgi:hypothetical protein